jgi:hypothetical protein
MVDTLTPAFSARSWIVALCAMVVPERILHFCAAENEGKEGKYCISDESIMKVVLSTV